MKKAKTFTNGYYYCRRCDATHEVDSFCPSFRNKHPENRVFDASYGPGGGGGGVAVLEGCFVNGVPGGVYPWELNSTVDTGPCSSWCLNQINTGDLVTNRSGRRIFMERISIRGVFASGVNSVASINALVLVYDNSPNYASDHATALPAITEVLRARSPYSQTNLGNTHRFHIIRRIVGNLAGGLLSEAAETPSVVPGDNRIISREPTEKSLLYFDELINLNGLETVWDDDTNGRLDHMLTGSLLLYALSDDYNDLVVDPVHLPSGREVNCKLSVRLYFKDDLDC